jgi:hypothetical protein
LTQLTDAYNTGFGGRALSLVDDAVVPPAVTITADGGGMLHATLDGTVICIQTHGPSASAAVEQALQPECDDAAAAAYTLKWWVERLHAPA